MGVLTNSILISCGALFLGGCTTEVSVNVRHAPEINLGAVKTIKVEKFSVGGHVNLNLGGNPLLNLLTDVVASGAVKPDGARAADAHHEGLSGAIAQHGYFQVTESDAADAKIGGSVSYSIDDHMSDSNYKDSNGNVVVTYNFSRKASATVAFHVTDRSGKTIGASTVSGSSEASWSTSTNGQSRGQAASHMEVLLQALENANPQVLQRIAPYFTTEQRLLQRGSADEINKGNKAAEKGNWQEAVNNWNVGMASKKQADRVAAMHNLAVYDEVSDKLDDALKKYQEVYATTQDSEDAKDVARVQGHIAEEAQLKQMEQVRSAAQANPAH